MCHDSFVAMSAMLEIVFGCLSPITDRLKIGFLFVSSARPVPTYLMFAPGLPDQPDCMQAVAIPLTPPLIICRPTISLCGHDVLTWQSIVGSSGNLLLSGTCGRMPCIYERLESQVEHCCSPAHKYVTECSCEHQTGSAARQTYPACFVSHLSKLPATALTWPTRRRQRELLLVSPKLQRHTQGFSRSLEQ